MSVKEKLVELLEPNYPCDYEDCEACPRFGDEVACLRHLKEVLADHLIANGVTVDAVEVVRCKDCTRRAEKESKFYNGFFCERMTEFMKPDDFCSYGERRLTMREHMGLYRGKRIDNGEWVEGDLLTLHDGRRFIVNNRFGACIDADGNFINTEFPFVVNVDPKSVGECTGLQDVNGKLIFEGDILRLDGDELPHWLYIGQKREVKYNAGGFDPLCEYDSDCCTFVAAGDCEIIGNIYDNPEILKEETE